jgi:hypothetical protein
LRWVLPHGALGVATGAIAIGTVATLKSITIIITIRTTISTATSTARDKAIGSTIRNTAEMPRMATEIRPINSADAAPAVRVALVVPEDPVGQAALAVPGSPVGQGALAAPGSPVGQAALAAPGSPVVPVALELETVPVAVLERELDQAAVVLVRDHLRVRLAVPLRTKSVTTPHRPDLVPLREAEEDLAAVGAATTREPVAAEAAVAWAAAE